MNKLPPSSLTSLKGRNTRKTCFHCHLSYNFLASMAAESLQENSLFPVKVTSSYIYFHMLAEFLYTVCAYLFFKFLSYCCANLIRYPLGSIYLLTLFWEETYECIDKCNNEGQFISMTLENNFMFTIVSSVYIHAKQPKL